MIPNFNKTAIVLSEKEQIVQLLKEFESLKKEFELFKEATKIIINTLKDQNNLLKERLAKYENPKNSKNRRHSYLNYKTINEFELNIYKQKLAA